MMCFRVGRMWIQPVKSLRGFEVTSARLDALGFEADRRFLVVDATGRFLTQRSHPQMARVTAALDHGNLVLDRAGAQPCFVPLVAGAPPSLRPVSIWKSEGLLAEDCGGESAQWLSDALGSECALVRTGAAFDRPIPAQRVPPTLDRIRHAPRVAFPDAFPLMVLGEATVEDLGRRLGNTAAMERFRPSFTVEGSAPYAEDFWPAIRVAGAVLHAAGPCARCILTTVDPWTGERGHEPLRELSGYRRDPVDAARVNFGVNLVHAPDAVGAVIRVGDAVEPISQAKLELTSASGETS